MAVVLNWFPPSRENFELISSLWVWFPLAASVQWLVSWYGMGKTSIPNSRLNLPGRIGWMTMELPGPLSLVYMMRTLPSLHGITDLAWQNKVLAVLYLVHYSYRAVVFPLLQPSMSPLHALVWLSAAAFQTVNATCLGAWLAAYGPTTSSAWRAQLAPGGLLQFSAGLAIFYLGFAANYYHDDELREIRRREMARQARIARQQPHRPGAKPATVDKHYEIPQAGLFQYMLYPHYLLEWVEWFGFWMACGWSCIPARTFLVNEMASMLPRAVNGKKWYVDKFGADKIQSKWAVIPGIC